MRRTFEYRNFYFHFIWSFWNIIRLFIIHFLHIYQMQETSTNGLSNKIRYLNQTTIGLKSRLKGSPMDIISRLIISPFQGYSIYKTIFQSRIQSLQRRAIWKCMEGPSIMQINTPVPVGPRYSPTL